MCDEVDDRVRKISKIPSQVYMCCCLAKDGSSLLNLMTIGQGKCFDPSTREYLLVSYMTSK